MHVPKTQTCHRILKYLEADWQNIYQHVIHFKCVLPGQDLFLYLVLFIKFYCYQHLFDTDMGIMQDL